MELHLPVRHALRARLHARILEKPLLAQTRLNGHIRALAEAHVVLVRLLLHEHAQLREPLRRHLARLEPVQPAQVRTGEVIHGAVGVDDFDHGQLVARADVEVRLVVRGRHLEHTGAELEVHMGVADDGDELLLARQLDGQRSHDVLADEVRVARVLRVHGHGGVAGDGLGPRRGNGQPCSRRFGHLDLEVIHEALLRLHLHLFVGQRGLRCGAPVHHAFAAIDEALLVKLDEDLLHAARILRVHREPLARPVARATEFLELVDDDAAVLVLPRPHSLEELLAPEVVLGFLLVTLQRLFHLHLRCDAGVVGAGEPEDFLAVHACLAAEDVLDGVV